MTKIKNFSLLDTGLTFKGHPILLGSNKFNKPANDCVLAELSKFLEEVLPSPIVSVLANASTGHIDLEKR
jgi:hypothetical protein